MFRIILLFISGVVLISSCCNCDTKVSEDSSNSDAIGGVAFADTIVYDVIIKNTSPDDFWTEECLKNLDRQGFVNDLFQNIYNGELTAFHFLTNEKIEVRDLKALEREKGYSRDGIGKMQFAETWYYDASSQVFEKKILSVVLGMEQFDQEGKLKGYKPLFKVYFK